MRFTAVTIKGHFRNSIEPLEHVTHVMCTSSKEGQANISSSGVCLPTYKRKKRQQHAEKENQSIRKTCKRSRRRKTVIERYSPPTLEQKKTRTKRSSVKNKNQQRGKKLRAKAGKRVTKGKSSKSNGRSKKTIDRKLSISTKQKTKKAGSKTLRAKRAGKRAKKCSGSKSNGQQKMPIARKLAIFTQPKAQKIGSQTLPAKKENPVPAQTFHWQNLPNERQPIELVIDRSFGVPPPATIVIDSDTKIPDKQDFCWGEKYFRILYKGPMSRSLPLLGLTVTKTGVPGIARRIQTSKSISNINLTPVYLFREILFRRPGTYQIRAFPWSVNRGGPMLEISTVVKLRQRAMDQQKKNSFSQIPPMILAASHNSESEMRLSPNKRLQSNTCDEQCSINPMRLDMDTSLRHSSNSSQRGELGMTMAHRGQNNNSSQHEKSRSDSCDGIENIHPTTTTTTTALPRPDSEPAAVIEIGTDTDAKSGSCIDSVTSDSKELFHISQGREKARQTCTMTSSIDQTLALSENLDTFAQSNQNQGLLTPGTTEDSIVESEDSADDEPQDWSVHDMFSFEFD